ncbi:MAG TPA: hypothetical protein VH559_03590 [Gemmatimonadaceae bacterium]
MTLTVHRAEGQTPTAIDSTLVRQLFAEAWVSVGEAASQRDDERVAKLAARQATFGDVANARANASRFAQSWFPFARIAIVQRDAGDVAGAIQTTRLAHTAMDRSQALGYFAQIFTYTGKIDSALAIGRTIPWPKERVETLKGVAMTVRERDTTLARSLLREAIGIAQADTSFWGRYFDVELAYDQAGVGDLAGALRVVSGSLPADTLANRLGRIASAMQGAPIRNARAVADSLFRLALIAADAIPDSTKQRRVRAVIRRDYSAYLAPNQAALYQAESRSRDELVNALSARITSKDTISRPMEALAQLEALGDYRSGVEALRARLIIWEMPSSPTPDSLRALLDTRIRRMLVDARMVSAAYVDTTRAWFAEAYRCAPLGTARAHADSIRDATLRSRTFAKVATHCLWRGSADSALALTELVESLAERDDLYAGIAWSLLGSRLDEAIAMARRIGSESRRGIALAAVADVVAKGDRGRGIRLYAEALSTLDPLARGFSESSLASLVALDEVGLLRQWARGLPTAEGRAAAYVAIIRSIVPGSLNDR